jgi:hypothetical protein
MKQIILNADAMGFGDLCVTAFISEGSKGKETELIHWATGEKRKVLEMFGQKIAPSNEGSITALKAYDIELSERGSLPRVLNRSYELGIFSEPKSPTVKISDSAKNWAAEQKKIIRSLWLCFFQKQFGFLVNGQQLIGWIWHGNYIRQILMLEYLLPMKIKSLKIRQAFIGVKVGKI